MRLSLGGFSQVTLTDRWFTELRSGRAFLGYGNQAAVAGQNSHVQFKNPAASGKQAIVARIRLRTSTSNQIDLVRYDTDLATDVGAVVNALIGGAAGVCHVRKTTNAGILGTVIDNMYAVADTWYDWFPTWGPELSPGGGIAVVCETVNIMIQAGFMVNEV